MLSTRGLGKEAEDEAADYLIAKGYTIITRRLQVGHKELDLVALDGETLVFVEVKKRSAPGYIPEDAITPKKVKMLRLAAEKYVIEMGESNRQIRFDTIAIDSSGVRHYENAF